MPSIPQYVVTTSWFVPTGAKQTELRCDYENYDRFSTDLRIIAGANGADQLLLRPPATPQEATLDMKLKAHIIMYLSQHLRKETAELSTASEVWKFLEDRYQNSLYLISSDLHSKWEELSRVGKGDETMEQFFTRVLQLRDKLRLIGTDYSDKSVGNKVVRVLAKNPIYFSALSTIYHDEDAQSDLQVLLKRLMTFDALIRATVVGEDAQQPAMGFGAVRSSSEGSTPAERKAGEAAGEAARRLSALNLAAAANCYSRTELRKMLRHKGKGNHGQQQGGGNHGQHNNDKRGPRCYECHEFGHLSYDCPKKKGNGKGRVQQATAWTAVIANGAAGKSDVSGSTHEFTVDSGASHHMVNDISMLDEVGMCDPIVHKVHYADGGEGEVSKMGTMSLLVTNPDGLTVPVVVQSVMYVPGLKVNLLSVSKMTKAGSTVRLYDDKAVIRCKSGTVVAPLSSDGVYKLEAVVCSSKYSSSIVHAASERKPWVQGMTSSLTQAGVTAPSSVHCGAARMQKEISLAVLWHRRMGHLGWDSCAHLPNVVSGVDVSPTAFREAAALHECDACEEGKLARNPFPPAERKASAPLEQLCCDVLDAGTDVTRPGGDRYIATVVDTFSGFAAVTVLKSKAQVKDALKSVIITLQRQANNKVKRLRFDRGGEYMSADLQNWCASRGILLEPTAPYSPQQNGRAERFNRVLLERSRCMLADAQLSTEHWKSAAMYAAQLRNRSPYAPTGRTPWEGMFGEKPDVSRFRVFGCKVHYQQPKSKRSSKWAPVGIPGIFLGFDGGGYSILDTVTNKLIVTRDVHFHECAPAPAPAAHDSESSHEGIVIAPSVVDVPAAVTPSSDTVRQPVAAAPVQQHTPVRLTTQRIAIQPLGPLPVTAPASVPAPAPLTVAPAPVTVAPAPVTAAPAPVPEARERPVRSNAGVPPVRWADESVGNTAMCFRICGVTCARSCRAADPH